MARLPTNFTVEWRPPWEGNLKEDSDLQQKAAERLAKYVNEGKLHNGRSGNRPVVGITAEPEFDDHARSWVIVLRCDLEIDVTIGGIS